MVENELKKGQIKVVKVDLDNNEVKLQGVKFDVLDENGKVLETITTNENGEALTSRYAVRDFSKLTLRETETLNNYVLNETPQTITLKANETTPVTFENELKKGQIRVIKVDLDNNEVKLQGVEFKVYDEDGNLVDTLVTDENGEATSKRLRIDKEYKVVESKTLDNYVLNETPQTVTLKQDQITDMTFTNELKKGQVRVIKVDKDNNEVKLQGVEFKVYDEDGNLVDTLVTDENGEATSKRLRIDKEYKVVESKTLDNYVLNETPQTVTLKQDQITDLTFENELIKGFIKIIKESSEDNPCNGDTKGTKLENAKFEIYNDKDELVDTLVTDENGECTSKALPKAKYTIKEVESPNFYVLTDETFEVEIVKHQETLEVNISNTPDKPSVDIEKTGIIQTTANEEIRYDFKIKNTGNVPLDHFTWYDYLPSDYVKMGKLITGTYNQDLNYSIYYKTNLNDYRLLVENLNTQTNNYIDFTNIKLEDGEVITEFKAEFGTVDVGFESVENPYIFVTVNDTVENDDTFTNKTRIEGDDKGYLVWDEDDHTTKVYEKELKVKLPRTGC